MFGVDTSTAPFTTLAPTEKPVSLEEAKLELRITWDGENSRIDSYIQAATDWGQEVATWRQFVTATRTLHLDEFPGSTMAIPVPFPPLSSVTTVKYIDTDGTQQTWASSKYRVDTSSEPGRITPAFDQVWPVTRAITDAVEVEFVCGYGAASAVPQGIKKAILWLVVHQHENRQPIALGPGVAEIPWTMRNMFAQYSVKGFV